jgi:site-specific DNA recombinase
VPASHILVDEGISGTTMDRPGLRRLRELATSQAVAAVIIIDPDRLSRNLGHQLVLAEEFERAGVQLLIVSHPLEQGPEGWLFFQMRGALAEYERAKILERTQRGRIGRATAGNPGGGQVPLGYRAVREPHHARWSIEEEEAGLVRRMFAMCLQGMTTYAITEQLSQERVPTCRERGPQGGRRRLLALGVWNEASVHKILTNEAYAGRAYWGKYQRKTKTTRQRRPRAEWITIPVPAIIDQATFDAVQAQLTRNRERAPRNQRRPYLLSGGYLRCGRCGRRMTGTAPKGVPRYHCSSLHSIHDADARCRGSVAAAAVEQQVWGAVARILAEPALIAAEVRRQQAKADEQRAAVLREMTLVHDALTKCDREEQRWADAYAGEVISLHELKNYRAEIAVRRQHLDAQRETFQATLESIGQAVHHVEALVGYCERVRAQLQTFDAAEKRRALDALTVRAYWTPAKPLRIEGSIPLEAIEPMPSGQYFG